MSKTQRRKLLELYFAICKEDVKQVRELISDGVDVNTVDNKKTPLDWVIERDPVNINIARVLIKAGADINIANKQFFSAFERGDIKKVRELIAVGVNVDNIVDENGYAPLNRAAFRNNINMVKTLINKGADVNITDENRYTPLICATINNCMEVVKTLINEGADINIAKDGCTPLGWAVGTDHIIIVGLIVNHIVKLEAAGLYVSEENLEKKNEFINTSRERSDNYSQHSKNCEEEVKKIKKRNESLHDFLRENDVNKMADIWEQNENLRDEFDNEENLKKLYPEYVYILINKASEVKKEIFLHNHKPLIDVLSKNYEKDFQKMSFAGIENFSISHGDDYSDLQQETRVTLIGCLDFEDVKERHVPKLKVKIFAEMIENEGINSNLKCPSTEQPQELNRAFN